MSGAELLFTERPFVYGDRGLPGWDGRLLNPDAIDRATGRRAANYIAKVDYCRPYGSLDGYGEPSPAPERRYLVTVQTRSKFARRYYRFATLDEAQNYLIDWAKRRFKVVP